MALRSIMPNHTIAKNYAGGLVGYLSYEAVNYFEPSLHIKVHDLFDQFMFGVYTDGLVLDKHTNEIFYFYHNVDRSNLLKRIMEEEMKKDKPLQIKFMRDSLSPHGHKKSSKSKKNTSKQATPFSVRLDSNRNTI